MESTDGAEVSPDKEDKLFPPLRHHYSQKNNDTLCKNVAISSLTLLTNSEFEENEENQKPLNDFRIGKSKVVCNGSCNLSPFGSDNDTLEHSHDILLKSRSRMDQRSFHQNAFRNVGESSNTQKLEEQLLNYRLLREKFNQLHCDYHNLIGVTAELTQALESSVRGKHVDLIETLNTCLQIFPDLFSHKHERKSKYKVSKEKSVFKAPTYKQNLNIPLIQKHLMEGSVKTRLVLLQALRWAVTKNSRHEREHVIHQFVTCDLLDINREALLKSLLSPPGVQTPHPLQQLTARLLNTLASVKHSRGYLAQNSVTVDITVTVLQQHDGTLIDLITRNMLIATLQKLSLRRYQRTSMIQLGLVEWLFQHLPNGDPKSSYFLEYGTALLMNLCLHQSAKQRCLPIAQSVFTVLKDLLSTQATQAVPYINGTLYSLLTHHQLNEVAAQFGMAEVLKTNIKKQINPEVIKQWDYILSFHQSLLLCEDAKSDAPLSVSEGEMIDEDNEEIDLLGEELDECDPVRSIKGELIGEELLLAYYTLPKRSSGYIATGLSEGKSGGFPSFVLRPTSHHHLHHSADETKPPELEGCDTVRQSERPAGLSESTTKEDLPFGGELGHPEKDYGSGILSTENYAKAEISIDPEVPGHQKVSNEFLQEASTLTEKQSSAEAAPISDPGEDSEDVFVGFVLPSRKKDLADSQEIEVDDLEVSKTEIIDTAAFTSRPKIPRTPPHQM